MKLPASTLYPARLHITPATWKEAPEMKQAKLFLSLLCLLLPLAIAGCGGHAAQSMQAASPATPMPTPGSTTPSNAKTISDIQKLGGWQTCSGVCSATAHTNFSMAQGVASPSL